MKGKIVDNILNRKQARRKYFCLSMQRSGTTSVGKFFRDIGLRCAGWHTASKNGWSMAYHDGDLEGIFSSDDFRKADAFEDGPWFHPGFHRILYHRFPGARFILLTRDPDDWFASMMSHSGGNILGRSRIHSKIYRREEEFLDLLDGGLIDEAGESFDEKTRSMSLHGLEEHYKRLYRLHEREVVDFFSRHAPEALFVGRLDDPNKWQKIARFLGVNIPENYDSHENASQPGSCSPHAPRSA